MSNNKWIRPISFNRNNQKDKERLDFIGRKSFSRFIKKLIDEEIKRKKEILPEPEKEVIEVIPEIEETILPIEEEKTLEEKPKRNYEQYYQNAMSKPLINTEKPPRNESPKR
ncbi:hypothetical protein [Schinkia azotoformans]|uniref:hypothetical protein n=1 Tax=Schinkia azotoformans TaxID=1454 RepID=UPI002DB8C0C3|nr:hypothetical protein [Schinkia azotoformans]MEC1697772.1 hypothetical protein [Schinkia azotoformans]